MKLLMVLGGIAILLCGCKKSEWNELTYTAEDSDIAEQLFEDMFNTCDVNDNSEATLLGMANNIEQITCEMKRECIKVCVELISISNFERNVTFDFGNGCNTNSKIRTGEVTLHRKGYWLQKGSEHTVTTSNYRMNLYHLKGSRKITNTGLNPEGQWTFTIEDNGVVRTPEGEKITWHSIRTRTWIDGHETWAIGNIGMEGIYDDVWRIEGVSSGTNRKGLAFEMNIIDPLRVKWCDYSETYLRPRIVEGEVLIEPEGLDARILNYGVGVCDARAEVRIGDKLKWIRLK